VNERAEWFVLFELSQGNTGSDKLGQRPILMIQMKVLARMQPDWVKYKENSFGE